MEGVGRGRMSLVEGATSCAVTSAAMMSAAVTTVVRGFLQPSLHSSSLPGRTDHGSRIAEFVSGFLAAWRLGGDIDHLYFFTATATSAPAPRLPCSRAGRRRRASRMSL